MTSQCHQAVVDDGPNEAAVDSQRILPRRQVMHGQMEADIQLATLNCIQLMPLLTALTKHNTTYHVYKVIW